MKRIFKYTAVSVIGFVAVVAAFLAIQQGLGNFHTVVEGELYRSAQLQSGDIAAYQQQYHIKSIINLRGENTGAEWYDTEVKEAAQAGVTHLNFRMSSKRELSQEQAAQLIAMMHDAPKPLLIHCRAGSDRTGLASALYVAAVSKGGEEAAERQLWLYYGHLPLFFTSAYAMNRSFENLEAYLGFGDS